MPIPPDPFPEALERHKARWEEYDAQRYLRLTDDFRGQPKGTLAWRGRLIPGYPRIGRIFDNLQADRPVLRYNWSLYDSPALFVPRRGPRRWISEAVDPDANIFIRIERQTLRRLPQSGDILFTIKVLMDPLGAIRQHPGRVSLADSMRHQLLALNADELAYKGLTETRDKVAAALQVIAGPAEAA